MSKSKGGRKHKTRDFKKEAHTEAVVVEEVKVDDELENDVGTKTLVKEEEQTWSDWTWSPEQAIYYRARKGYHNVWQYEYAEPQVPTESILKALEPVRYEPSPVEFPAEVKGAVYLLEEQYNPYVAAENELLACEAVPVCPGLANLTLEGSKKEVIATVKDVAISEEKSLVEQKDYCLGNVGGRKAESKGRVDKVDEWRRSVIDAIEKDAEINALEQNSKPRKKERYIERRESRHKDKRK